MIEQSLEEQIVSKLNSKTGSGEYILEASEYDDLALFIEDWISWLSELSELIQIMLRSSQISTILFNNYALIISNLPILGAISIISLTREVE